MGLSQAGDAFAAGHGVEEGLHALVFVVAGHAVEHDAVAAGEDELVLFVGAVGAEEEGVFEVAAVVGDVFYAEDLLQAVLLHESSYII